MGKNRRRLIVAEVLFAFVPLCIGWAILVLLSVFHLTLIGTPEFRWESLALMVGLCLAGGIGGIGLNAMCVYLLYEGKRLIPKTRMVAFCVIGVVALAAMVAVSFPGVLAETPDYFGVVYAVPLVCALHILWLGRSYFAER